MHSGVRPARKKGGHGHEHEKRLLRYAGGEQQPSDDRTQYGAESTRGKLPAGACRAHPFWIKFHDMQVNSVERRSPAHR